MPLFTIFFKIKIIILKKKKTNEIAQRFLQMEWISELSHKPCEFDLKTNK